MAADRAGALLHGFEQRRLRFGRRAVDFVGQQNVAEDRAVHEGPLAMAGGEIFFDDVGAGDVRGHQVRRELDAPELRPSVSAMVRTISVLAVPGKPVIRQCPPTNKRGEDLIEHLILADDHLAHLGKDAVAHRMEPFDAML